jgi:hypothetical protein
MYTWGIRVGRTEIAAAVVIVVMAIVVWGETTRQNKNPISDSNMYTDAPSVVETWNCGGEDDYVTATLYSDGRLVVSGTGEMKGPVTYSNIMTKLTSVEIGNGVTMIGSRTFYHAINMTSITIPNSVTRIGYKAFYQCFNLTSISIPNSVTEIGTGAFMFSGLTSMTIPNSVTEIGYQPFHADNLTSIHVAVDNTYYSELDGVLFNKDKTVLIDYPKGRQGAYIIPDGVTKIEDLAFIIRTGLTSVTIPSSVMEIGESAFTNCTSLTSITIPNSVAKIGSFAFYNCNRLTSITVQSLLPPNLGREAFGNIDLSNVKLIVPESSINAYRSAEGWKGFF